MNMTSTGPREEREHPSTDPAGTDASAPSADEAQPVEWMHAEIDAIASRPPVRRVRVKKSAWHRFTGLFLTEQQRARRRRRYHG